MSIFELLRQAFTNVRTNLLRSVLTMLIIAFGIMALVGILTSIDSTIYSLSDSFAGMGANSFEIEPKTNEVQGRRFGRRQKIADPVSVKQAQSFKERYEFPAKVSITYPGSRSAQVKFETKKTDPNVAISGIDENYLDVKGYDLSAGRNFTKHEIASGNFKAIITDGIVKKLFRGNPEKALEQSVIVNGHRFRVIGVLKSKGSAMNFSGDRSVLIPFENARINFSSPNLNIPIIVKVLRPPITDRKSTRLNSSH